MRIQFQCTGGGSAVFAKRPLAYQADTEQLPQELRDRLQNLVKTSGILDLDITPKAAGAGPQRDVFTYRLSIVDQGVARTLTFDDVSAPPVVRPLLSLLQQLALDDRMTKAKEGR